MISDKKINKFEKSIGYVFKNKKLLINSLVHPSSIIDNKKNKIKADNDFERLEFLGDRVLGLAISSIIYAKFTKNNEGDLSKKLSYLVQKNFLHKISIDLKIDDREFEKRIKKIKLRHHKKYKGVVKKYINTVSSASEGCITD